MNIVTKNGYTLVELIVALTIVVILAMFMIGGLHPGALVGKAHDAKRKSDMARIKVSFEEYFNNVGCYPTTASGVLSQIQDKANCGAKIDALGLSSLPCDPVSRAPYTIYVEHLNGNPATESDCPHNYSILTKLENTTDENIPANWSLPAYTFRIADGSIPATSVNYGVSSSNILWYQSSINPDCMNGGWGVCYSQDANGTFRSLPPDAQYKPGYSAALNYCLVECCFNGTPCP